MIIECCQEEAFRDIKGDKNHIDSFANDLRGARRESIDAFLNDQPKYKDIGKLAIAHILRKREIQDFSAVTQNQDFYLLLLNNLF